MGQEVAFRLQPAALLYQLRRRLEGVLWSQATAEGPPAEMNVNNSQCRSVSKCCNVLCRQAMYLPHRGQGGSPSSDQSPSIQLASVSRYPRTMASGRLPSYFWQSLCKAYLQLTPPLPQARFPTGLPGTVLSPLRRPWKEGHLRLEKKQAAVVQGTGTLKWNKNCFLFTV